MTAMLNETDIVLSVSTAGEQEKDVGLITSKTGRRRLRWISMAQGRHDWRKLVSKSLVTDLQAWRQGKVRQNI